MPLPSDDHKWPFAKMVTPAMVTATTAPAKRVAIPKANKMPVVSPNAMSQAMTSGAGKPISAMALPIIVWAPPRILRMPCEATAMPVTTRRRTAAKVEARMASEVVSAEESAIGEPRPLVDIGLLPRL